LTGAFPGEGIGSEQRPLFTVQLAGEYGDFLANSLGEWRGSAPGWWFRFGMVQACWRAIESVHFSKGWGRVGKLFRFRFPFARKPASGDFPKGCGVPAR